MTLNDIFGEYAFVAKVNVSNLAASLEWYESKLGLIPDPSFQTATWAQLNLPGIPQVAIGLSVAPQGIGTAGAVSTFVVDDITAASNGLIEQGVQVGPITNVGDGVLLCFFQDPDGNTLGLRQNSPS